MNLQPNVLDQTVPVLYPDWTVSFEIKPFGVVPGLANIIHLTAGGEDVTSYGDRVPGIWFHGGTTKLHICSSVNSNKNYCVNPLNPLAVNEWTSVEISQRRNYRGDFEYIINLGNGYTHSIVNIDAQRFENVQVFTSDPWYPTAAATMRKLDIQTALRTLLSPELGDDL